MKILVDADACPVKQIILDICKKYSIKVILFVDTSHFMNMEQTSMVTIKMVDKQMDSVDFAIVNNLDEKDIVVTQDYGLASMVMAKNAIPIHQNGFIYDEKNIDSLLFSRHISKKIRQSGGKTSNFKKRTKQNDLDFAVCFENLLIKQMNI